MDGTLVDSTRVVEHAWTGWANRHGFPLEAVLSFAHGRPTIATLDHFLPGCDHSEELEEMDHSEETDFEGIVAIPGAKEVIDALGGHPWAVVTSAWRTLAETRIAAAGLPIPKVMVPVDEIRSGKPDPEGFLRAAEQLGTSPELCLVFEDTRPGIVAGTSAGMQVVGLLTTMPSHQLQHRPLIRDFRDVAIRLLGNNIEVNLREAL